MPNIRIINALPGCSEYTSAKRAKHLIKHRKAIRLDDATIQLEPSCARPVGSPGQLSRLGSDVYLENQRFEINPEKCGNLRMKTLQWERDIIRQ